MKLTKQALSLFLILAASMAGCASLGFEKPETFDDRLAYAVAQNAAVRKAAVNAYRSGAITQADAVKVLELTDEARTLLDAARFALTAGDLATAEARLSLATAILVRLNAYLQERDKA